MTHTATDLAHVPRQPGLAKQALGSPRPQGVPSLTHVTGPHGHADGKFTCRCVMQGAVRVLVAYAPAGEARAEGACLS